MFWCEAIGACDGWLHLLPWSFWYWIWWEKFTGALTLPPEFSPVRFPSLVPKKLLPVWAIFCGDEILVFESPQNSPKLGRIWVRFVCESITILSPIAWSDFIIDDGIYWFLSRRSIVKGYNHSQQLKLVEPPDFDKEIIFWARFNSSFATRNGIATLFWRFKKLGMELEVDSWLVLFAITLPSCRAGSDGRRISSDCATIPVRLIV